MNVMELSARLSLDAKNFDKGIKSAESGFKSFGSRLSSIGGKIVKGLSVATAAAAAGFVALGKNAVNAYAQYEQLVGGVETLFKDSAGQLQKYADVSYKTAGVSANRFMEMSTSFAAALVQGLGGDTARAADMANTAIIDMSDNANKMGTDMTMLQNAYKGFAKQNFTMLDNLKIGYGGTKTEMERLLSDAEKLTGKKYDVSNFADIVDAIHAIQTQMGITGTTAQEAEHTISGSMNMVKAAWEDMLVAMSKPEEVTTFFGNIQDESDATAKSIQKGPQEATRRFANSVKTMLGNVLPTVRNFLNGFGEVVAEIAPIIGEELPQLLADFAPKLLEAGKNLVVGLGKGITKAFQKFKWPTWKDVQPGAQKAWKGIQKGVEWLGGLVFGTDPKTGGVKWPTWADVKDAALKAWDGIKKGALTLAGLVFGKKEDGSVDWPTWDDVAEFGKAAWKTITDGALSLAGLVFGKKEDGSVDWPTWDDVKDKASEVWEAIKVGAKGLAGLVFGTKEDGSVDWPTWESIKDSFDTWWNGTFLPNAQGAMKWTLKLFGMPEETVDSIVTLFTDWWNGLKGAAESAIKWTLGEPGAPHATGQAIHDLLLGWWNNVKAVALSAIEWFIPTVSGMLDPEGQGALGVISDWWENHIKPFLGDILNFTLGLFGLPSAEEMVANIKAWWAEVVKSVGNLVLNIGAIFTGGDPNIQSTGLGESGIKKPLKGNVLNNAQTLQAPGSLGEAGNRRRGAPKAIGDWDVPYDNFPVLLHRKEMVLNATRARQYREGRDNSLDASTLAQAMRSAVLDLTMELNGEAVGRVFGDQTTRRVNRNISQINRRHRYGYGG